MTLLAEWHRQTAELQNASEHYQELQEAVRKAVANARRRREKKTDG